MSHRDVGQMSLADGLVGRGWLKEHGITDAIMHRNLLRYHVWWVPRTISG